MRVSTMVTSACSMPCVVSTHWPINRLPRSASDARKPALPPVRATLVKPHSCKGNTATAVTPALLAAGAADTDDGALVDVLDPRADDDDDDDDDDDAEPPFRVAASSTASAASIVRCSATTRGDRDDSASLNTAGSHDTSVGALHSDSSSRDTWRSNADVGTAMRAEDVATGTDDASIGGRYWLSATQHSRTRVIASSTYAGCRLWPCERMSRADLDVPALPSSAA